MSPLSADHFARVQDAALAFLKDPERRHEWRAFYDLAHTVPVVYLERGEWLLAGWDDVVSVMRHEGSELTALYPATSIPSINELFLGMLPFEHGIDHRRLRSLVTPLFSGTAMSCLHHQISALLDKILYPAVFEPEGCDVLNTLGVRIPEAVSCLLLDVAPEDWESIGYWSRQMYSQLGHYNQSEAETRESETVFHDFTEYVRRRMKDDSSVRYGGVGESLLKAWHKGELDDRQLTSYFALFLLTGLDTLTYSIGNAIWFLGNAQDVFFKLRQEPKLTDYVYDEAMRLWGPIRLCVRHLQSEARISVGTLPQGSIVFLLIHAANRDPRRLDRPDQLLWDRKSSEDLAFGVGHHGCLGTAVGKLVWRTLYRSVAKRCKSLRVSPGINNARFIPSLPILGIEAVRLFAEAAEPY